jgi:hypothetical protein
VPTKTTSLNSFSTDDKDCQSVNNKSPVFLISMMKYKINFLHIYSLEHLTLFYENIIDFIFLQQRREEEGKENDAPKENMVNGDHKPVSFVFFLIIFADAI